MQLPNTTSKAAYSLIEILIVIAIVGILVGLATPSWHQHLLRAQRSDAMNTLLRVAVRQTQYLLQNNSYATEEQLSLAPPNGLGIAHSSQQHYDITLPAQARGYLATARARTNGMQFKDKLCRTFSLDATGQRMSRDHNGVDTTENCWK
jgi:type IV pilus assembly protein PilE